MKSTRQIVASLAVVLLVAASARAADSTSTPSTSTTAALGPQLGKATTVKVKIGVVITADSGPCRGLLATVPVPMNWPEQTVKVVKEEKTPNVPQIRYRTLSGTVRQMIVQVPRLKQGDEARATVTLEITRHTLLPPADPSAYKLLAHPEKHRELLIYLNPSPFIESRNEKIVKLAKEVTAGKEDWAKVEAIYDAVQARLTYREGGPIKGALAALEDGHGHCEEFSSLFIAMCRAVGIPARTVWVPEHCYNEFYMVDAAGSTGSPQAGHGYWFPCQSSGDRSFGGIPETRYILQKGDNFHDPDRASSPAVRYIDGYMRGVGGQPKVEFVRTSE